MPKVTRRERRLVARLIRRARVQVPAFGRGTISPAELWLLLDSAGIQPVTGEIGPACLLLPRLCGGRELLVRAGVPASAMLYLLLREVARVWTGDVPGARVAAEVFAAVGAHAELSVAPQSLASIDAPWFATHWPEIRETADQTVAELLRRRPTAGGVHSVEAERARLEACGLRSEGEQTRAISTFRTARDLARRAGDWNTAARATIGAAKSFALRVNYPRARRLLSEAIQLGRRKRIRDAIAAAKHEMFSIAVEVGQSEHARRLAPKVYRAYGPGHPRLRHLARDIAHFWISEGEFARGLPLALETIHHAETLAEEIQGWTTVARAAGGAGDWGVFSTAVAEATRRLEADQTGEGVAESILDLARGAAMLGLRDEALRYGRQALEIATLRSEARVRIEADVFCDSAGREERARRAVQLARSRRGERDALAEIMISDLRERRQANAGARA